MITFRKIIPENIVGVKVYLEGKKTRFYVGKLFCEGQGSKTIFHFEYEEQYLNYEKAIPLGPELPLTQSKYRSKTLFPSFQDRIPSRKNAAYAEYCESVGILETEMNPLILLATIGKRGPSSFVFEPILKEEFSAQDLKDYRTELNLSIRDFAMLFDLSPSHIQRIESNTYEGRKTLEKVKLLRDNLPMLINKMVENVKIHPSIKKALMEKLVIRMKKNIIQLAGQLQEHQGVLADWQKAMIADAIIYCYAGRYAVAYELLNILNSKENIGVVGDRDLVEGELKSLDMQEGIELAMQKLILIVEPFILLQLGEAFWEKGAQPDLILPCEIKLGKICLLFRREVVDDYFLLKRGPQNWEEKAKQRVKEIVSRSEFKLKAIVIKKIESEIVWHQLNMGQVPLIEIMPSDFKEKDFRK